jgi:gp32 DNA binding protein like
MAQYSKEMLKQMRDHAAAVKKAMMGSGGSGGDFGRYADFSGKNAIVEPGKQVEIRLLPHWNFFADRYEVKGGKLVENPKYVRLPAWYPALEHWFDNPSTGKSERVWCPRVLGDDQKCPVCEAAVALRAGGADDRALAKRIGAKEIFLYNIVIRAAQFKDDGTPDVRILRAGGTVFTAITNLITGQRDEEDGGDPNEDPEKYALGDISDPWEGYDIKVARPAAQAERYGVTAARKSTRLYEPADKAKWGKWYELLWNLEKDVTDNVKSYEEIEKLLYPDKGGRGGGSSQPTGRSQGSSGGGRIIRSPASAEPPDESPVDLGGGNGADPGAGEEAPGGGSPFDFEMPGEEVPQPARQPSGRTGGRGGRR